MAVVIYSDCDFATQLVSGLVAITNYEHEHEHEHEHEYEYEHEHEHGLIHRIP